MSAWTFEIDGDDIVVRNIIATCFGGEFDKGDNGQTESGIYNDGREPLLMGVALPIRSTEAATRHSPLAFTGPHIPWESTVMVWEDAQGEDSALECTLIDNGPNFEVCPTHALDCNPNVALHFDPDFDPKQVANRWMRKGMSYRVKGAAKFVTPVP